MILRTLLILGGFSVMVMGETNATPVRTLASQENMGKIELIKSKKWCKRHSHHHKCHRHHHRHHHFDYMYDKRYNEREGFCRHNPFRDGCQRFCTLNPGTCSTKGMYR